ncbi:MAG: 4-hydroxy-tetrahydrodipicolinate reductase [Flavobacteriales bacterium]|nr:4-hydroxy-tetrahydrodipicolinate reductase [Flavobacteriales bacterium]
MKIALYGYGKMGKAIEEVAVGRGHEVVLRVTGANAGTAPTGADVAIEFSTPDKTLANMDLCLEHGVPVVVGTTGWYDQMNTVRKHVGDKKGSLLWASNFSIGVNLFFRVNRMLAGLMDNRPEYATHIDEIHHIHKLDAPSGTAITLARDIDLKTKAYSGFELKEGIVGARDLAPSNNAEDHKPDPNVQKAKPVPIHSERKGEVTGKHAVSWTSGNDRIVISHEAFDRSGFAMGAVIAAEWLVGKQGFFNMDDVLDQA